MQTLAALDFCLFLFTISRTSSTNNNNNNNNNSNMLQETQRWFCIFSLSRSEPKYKQAQFRNFEIVLEKQQRFSFVVHTNNKALKFKIKKKEQNNKKKNQEEKP